MDAPEPEWKYLSGFAVKKGPPEPAGRRITDRLIVPRRGPMTVNNSSATQGTVAPPAEPPEESAIPDTHEASEEQQENQLPAQLPATPVHEPQMEQVVPTARQTRSGRIVKSTPRYEQSIN